jgi:hypothetical protein
MREPRELRVIGDVARAPHEPATKLDTLEDILRWGGHVLEVIVQDEYNHDVIVVGHGDGFLVFDTT